MGTTTETWIVKRLENGNFLITHTKNDGPKAEYVLTEEQLKSRHPSLYKTFIEGQQQIRQSQCVVGSSSFARS
jgi:hypothetical protein